MNTAKHTPGPFWPMELDEPAGILYAIDPTDKDYMCKIAFVSSFMNSEQGMKLLYLFKAAPELLKSCNELLRIVEGFIAISQVGPTSFSCYLEAKTAIAKAEGLSNVSEANIARAVNGSERSEEQGKGE